MLTTLTTAKPACTAGNTTEETNREQHLFKNPIDPTLAHCIVGHAHFHGAGWVSNSYGGSSRKFRKGQNFEFIYNTIKAIQAAIYDWF